MRWSIVLSSLFGSSFFMTEKSNSTALNRHHWVRLHMSSANTTLQWYRLGNTRLWNVNLFIFHHYPSGCPRKQLSVIQNFGFSIENGWWLSLSMVMGHQIHNCCMFISQRRDFPFLPLPSPASISATCEQHLSFHDAWAITNTELRPLISVLRWNSAVRNNSYSRTPVFANLGSCFGNGCRLYHWPCF